GFSGVDTLEPIEWGEFFDAFEDNQLAFLYQDEPNSRFSKLVSRDGADQDQDQEGEEEEELEEDTLVIDAIDLLESQHREVEALFEQIREAESADEIEELVAELADQLAAHTKIEDTIFCPKVCDEDTSELLHEAVDEHFEAKHVLAELLEIHASDQRFMSKLEELEQLINHHVQEEETELFPQVREHNQLDLEALGRQLEKRFEKLITAEPRAEIPNELDEPAALPCSTAERPAMLGRLDPSQRHGATP